MPTPVSSFSLGSQPHAPSSWPGVDGTEASPVNEETPGLRLATVVHLAGAVAAPGDMIMGLRSPRAGDEEKSGAGDPNSSMLKIGG